MWLEGIGEKLGVAFRFTARLGAVLVNRARWIARQKFKGGRQRSQYLQRDWNLRVRVDELSFQQDNDALKEQNDALRLQADALQLQNDSLQEQNGHLRTENISLEDYTS